MSAWDAQPKEPQQAFAYFTLYRDMGPERSLPKIAQISAVSVPRLKQLSKKYGWVARCDQWDAHLDAKARQSYVTELEKQSRQRAQAHSALLGVALKVLLRGDLVNSAKLSEAVAAVKVATDGMRTEAGLATAKVEHEITDVRAVIDALPAAVSREVRSLLAGDAEPGSAREAAGELCGTGGERGGAGR